MLKIYIYIYLSIYLGLILQQQYNNRHIILSKEMKLTFTNKKQHKYCMFFIKALKEISNFAKAPVTRKPMYFYFTMKQIKISPSLADIHQSQVDSSCMFVINKQVYSLSGEEIQNNQEGKIYLIDIAKIYKLLLVSAKRINYIQFIIDNQSLEMTFTTQNDELECNLQQKLQQIEDLHWPQHYQSTRQIFYQVIDLINLKDKKLIKNKNLQDRQIWIQLYDRWLTIKTLQEGIVRKQQKIQTKQDIQSNYNFLTIKNKLKNKLSLSLKSSTLFNHLRFCRQRKKIAQLKILNIYDRYLQNSLRMSYLIIKTQMQYGYIIKVIKCYICQSMNKINYQEITRQLNKQRQGNKKNYLLKTQDNPQQVKKIVLNRFNDYDGEACIAEERFYQKNPFGKVQEGDQTYTRKFKINHE